MKYTHIKASYVVAALLALAIASPAFATTSSVRGDIDLKDRAEIKFDAKLTAGTDSEIQTRASAKIDARIKDLQSLQARINAMTHLSSATKTTLTANISKEIASLTALRSKINSETGDILKQDAQSITGSYRIYMLVLPQIRIVAAADRAQTVADMLTTLYAKLDARINAAVASGVTMTNEKAALSDMSLKIADAKVQAKAAIDLVANLVPDSKDQAKIAANEQAIVAARAKLKIAEADLKAAHADAKLILGEVKNHSKDNNKDHDKDNRGRN